MSFYRQQDFCASFSFFFKKIEKHIRSFTLRVDCRLSRVDLEKDPRHVERTFLKMAAQHQVLRRSAP